MLMDFGTRCGALTNRLAIGRVAIAVVVAMAAQDVLAQTSTYQATATGWVSQDKGVTQIPITVSQTALANGGMSAAGEGGTTVFLPGGPGDPGPIEAADTSVDGIASAEPGRIRARLDGFARDYFNHIGVPYGARLLANVGATALEYVPITHPTLPAGSEVNFTVSMRISGTATSELQNSGPYYFGPQFANYRYPTGTLFFTYTAYTANAATLAYNNDAVGTGTYSFPNSLFFAVPATYNSGSFFTYNMTGKVGDFLVLSSTLGLGVDNRAYRDETANYGAHQESHLDYSHTMSMFADAVTPGVQFVANGHNYASIPEPSAALLIAACVVALSLIRRT